MAERPDTALDVLFGEAAKELDGAINNGMENLADGIGSVEDGIYDGIDKAGDFVNETIPDKISQKADNAVRGVKSGVATARAMSPEMLARMEKLQNNMAPKMPSAEDDFYPGSKRYY